MDTDTYANADVIAFSNKQFVNIKLSGLRNKDLCKKLGAQGFPHTAIVSPDGELIARLSGYAGPKDYIATLQGMLEAWAKLPGLQEKAKAAADDLSLVKDIGDVYRTLNDAEKAQGQYQHVIDGVAAKKNAGEADKRLSIRSQCALLDYRVRSLKPDDIDEIETLLTKMKAADPDDKFGSLGNIAAVEVRLELVRRNIDGALKAGEEALKAYPTSDKADMILFDMAVANMQLRQGPEAKKLLKECSEKYPNHEYGKESKALLEMIEEQEAKKIKKH